MASLLTVLAIVAGTRALSISQHHFAIEQRPLIGHIAPREAGDRVAIPMAPRARTVSPPGVYIGRIPADMTGSGTELLAVSVPFENIGKGVASLTEIRLRPRSFRPGEGLLHTRSMENSFVAPERPARRWFNVPRGDQTEWLFELFDQAEAAASPGARPRIDIELVYTDSLGLNPQVAVLLALPRVGSEVFEPQPGDDANWYVEGVRYFQPEDDIEAYNARQRSNRE
jgi:hypothetical protein